MESLLLRRVRWSKERRKGNGLTDVKESHHLWKKGGTSPKNQFVWVKDDVWQVNREGLKLTQPPAQCNDHQEDCFDSQNSERAVMHGFKGGTHKIGQTQIKNLLGHYKKGTCVASLSKKRVTTGDLNRDG